MGMSLWTYTLFVDYSTGAALGFLYLAARLLYPLYYISQRGFTLKFESCTQIGYGVNGVLFLGTLYQGAGGDWAQFAKDNQILAPILGFLAGSFALLPGLPLLPLYT